MCVLIWKTFTLAHHLVDHSTSKRNCQNSPRIHQRIQTHHICTQRLGIFLNPSWLLRIVSVWNYGKQESKNETRKIRTLLSPYYTWNMAPQMETSTILSDHR